MELTTLFTGRNRLDFDTIESTNELLSSLQRASRLPEGTLLTARFQQGGKGQAGNRWHSEAGNNLLVSFLFYPTFLSAERAFHLQLFVSLAVSDTVNSFSGGSSSVKWPNDIYLQGGKVSGILPENVVLGGVVRQTIIGIGLNVNQVDFPTDIPCPVSLAQLLGQDISAEEVLCELCHQLERRYLQLQSGDHAGLLKAYHERLYRKDVWSLYESFGQEFEGRITGVDDVGRLLVETKDGKQRPYSIRQLIYK